MIHPFATPIDHIPTPRRFTYPFNYTPHPLCVLAAEEVKAYLATEEGWAKALGQGIMFGVLVVETEGGEKGYVAAFSGNLAGKNRYPFFVPPVYDLLQPGGEFRREEDEITAINRQIEALEADAAYIECKANLTQQQAVSHQVLAEAKAELKSAKEQREARRQSNPEEAELKAMTAESQHQKAEYKRLERSQKEQLAALQADADAFRRQIDTLKAERKARSAALQQWLFGQYQLLDAQGESRNLCSIFEETPQKTPPAGAGECAAPKLLQYAYLNGLKPVAMAEFWWGDSPKAQIRQHGNYYPACKGKCEPILRHMLQGLEVEDDPLLDDTHRHTEIEIVWEDEWLLVVDKPEGMLSVPGKADIDSVAKRMKARYAEATGPMVVHRLDMATSGLLLVAKTKEVHQSLQAQFRNRTVKKRYIALLDGTIEADEGVIDLPLCPDLLDRPRQTVDRERGKPAVTRFCVLDRKDKQTRIAFYPLTGRTHQLRVHAAHPLGLHHPIVGDQLYGKTAGRLYLHAECLEFKHPITEDTVTVRKEADF